MSDALRAFAARAYFALCRVLGRMLRSARYSTVRIVPEDGRSLVRKRRRFYASVLIWLSVPLIRVLNGGVQREIAVMEKIATLKHLLHGTNADIG